MKAGDENETPSTGKQGLDRRHLCRGADRVLFLPAETSDRGAGDLGHHSRSLLPPLLRGGSGNESDTHQKSEVFKRILKNALWRKKAEYISENRTFATEVRFSLFMFLQLFRFYAILKIRDRYFRDGRDYVAPERVSP